MSTDNKPIEGTLRERIIARQVSVDLSQELADTRLAPGERTVLDYLVPRHPNAQAIIMRVHVEPDYFYSGLYRSLLKTEPNGKGTGRASHGTKKLAGIGLRPLRAALFFINTIRPLTSA